MVVLCQILLDRTDDGVYRPGQAVAGTVKYYLDKPTEFESIDVSLIGEGLSRWSDIADTDHKTIFDKQDYLSMNKNILQSTQNGPVLQHEGGYDSTFNFNLPEYIPSSFTHKTSTITYKVVVSFKTANFFNSCKKFETVIPVFGQLSPCSAEPLSFKLKKEMFSMSLSNEVNIVVDIPKTFVSPGENIYLYLLVNNNSNVTISAIKTQLLRHFTYVHKKVKSRIQEERLKSTERRTPSVKHNSISRLTCVVPTSPEFYSIQHTRKVVIEYKVKVTAKIPFPHTNVSLEIPVVIGRRDDIKIEKGFDDFY